MSYSFQFLELQSIIPTLSFTVTQEKEQIILKNTKLQQRLTSICTVAKLEAADHRLKRISSSSAIVHQRQTNKLHWK